jgi:ferredoxin-type protein NapG
MTEKENKINSRRETIKTALKGIGALYVGGSVWAGFIGTAKGNKLVLRPPGALEEEEFLKACTKCGICIEVCPYDTLVVSSFKDAALSGTPLFRPRSIPCYMCTDVPCTEACPTTALDKTKLLNEDLQMDINKSQMGVAVIDLNNCIAHWGIQCDACYRACPQIDKAITQEYTRNERTGVHAKLTPLVHADACTGCGICEHVCITESPSVRVFPRDVALGETGDHYLKGWDEDDENRVKPVEQKKKPEQGIPGEDYLNNWEDLLDE